MNNFLKSKKAKGILANLSDVIKSNSVKENLDQFEVLNLDQIFSSFNNINQADDYHEHLDGQDFSYDADDVEAAFNEYNQLKKQFEEKYFSGLLFKPFVLANTVDFVLEYFSQINEQSEEVATHLLKDTVDAMNFPTYDIVASQRDGLKKIILKHHLQDYVLFSKTSTTQSLGQMPVFENTVVEDLGMKKDERGRDCFSVRTEKIPAFYDFYKKIVPVSHDKNVSVSYHTSKEGIHVVSLDVDTDLERLGYGAWLMHNIAQQADINHKEVFYSGDNLTKERLNIFSRQWCDFLYDTKQVNTFMSFQTEKVKYADSYKKKS